MRLIITSHTYNVLAQKEIKNNILIYLYVNFTKSIKGFSERVNNNNDTCLSYCRGCVSTAVTNSPPKSNY